MDTKFVIMNTFAGRYLDENSNKNIGHECINFFSPQDGDDHFLWLNSSGIAGGGLGAEDNVTLIMVTNFATKKNEFRILAVATDCHIVEGATKGYNEEERYNAFVGNHQNVMYSSAAGKAKLIQKIFAKNIYHGNVQGENTLATFVTNKNNVWIPRDENATIVIGKDVTGGIPQNMANEKMRMYIGPENNELVENALTNFSWARLNSATGQKRYPKDKSFYAQKPTFFTAIGKEKDELALSNIIAYSLSNSPALLKNFINKLASKNVKKLFANSAKESVNFSYSIEREKDHVDLSLEFPDFTFIIENKIEAGIVKYEEQQFENILVNLREKHKTLSGIDDLTKSPAGKKCQLTKYYIQSRIEAAACDRQDKPIEYFFLVPDYYAHKFQIKKGKLSGFACSENYKVIKYSELKKIFDIEDNYPYKQDLLGELELLGKPVDNSNMKREIYKFLNALE